MVLGAIRECLEAIRGRVWKQLRGGFGSSWVRVWKPLGRVWKQLGEGLGAVKGGFGSSQGGFGSS